MEGHCPEFHLWIPSESNPATLANMIKDYDTEKQEEKPQPVKGNRTARRNG